MLGIELLILDLLDLKRIFKLGRGKYIFEKLRAFGKFIKLVVGKNMG